MKFRITMKDPDGVSDCLTDAIRDELKEGGLPKDEQDALYEVRLGKAQEVMSRWFEYSEYLTVEVDTDAGTCVVVPSKP